MFTYLKRLALTTLLMAVDTRYRISVAFGVAFFMTFSKHDHTLSHAMFGETILVAITLTLAVSLVHAVRHIRKQDREAEKVFNEYAR